MADQVGGISEADRLSMQRQQSAADEVKVNEDEIFKLVEVAADKVLGTAAKLAQMIPLIGGFLSGLIPTNSGKVGLDAGLSTEGLAGKQIRPGSGGAQGGVLAKVLSEVFVKNLAIPGGSPHGDGAAGSGSSDGGGGDSGGGHGGSHSFESSIAGLEAPIIEAGGGNRFAHVDVSEGMLGTFSSPIIGDMGRGGRGAGFDMSA